MTTTLKIRRNGEVTLPSELRRKYDIAEGDVITFSDLEDGSFLLTTIVTQVDRQGDRVAKALAESGVSEDELLVALNEEREHYFRERYVQS